MHEFRRLSRAAGSGADLRLRCSGNLCSQAVRLHATCTYFGSQTYVAGLSRVGPLVEQPLSEIEEVLQTNVLGVVRVTQASACCW